MLLNTFYMILAEAQPVTSNPTPPETPTIDPVMAFTIAITAGIFGYMMLRRTRRRLAISKYNSTLTVKEKVAKQIPTTNIMYRQMGELMADLADLARQVNGQIDTRIAKLEYVIANADKKLEELHEATQRFQAQMAFQDNHTTNESETSRKPISESAPYDHPTPIEKKQEISPEVSSVLTLAKSGKTAVEIAKSLSRPTGEIELILALNKI